MLTADTLDSLLFPAIEPRRIGRIALDRRHEMYWEESGSANGIPVVFLHGGPGGGTIPNQRRFFDPTAYRIVLFDQRGCGQSTPTGDIAANTTADLVADIERLRVELAIDRWVVFGGSWGSTLALAYAQEHPTRCLGLVLRGIFLGERSETDWFMNGLATLAPEEWRAFEGAIPAEERHDLLAAYQRRLNDPNPSVSVPAAKAWGRYEGSLSTLLPNPELLADMVSDAKALPLARIEAHYLANDLFLRPGQLIEGVDAIRELPATIVQGRYDLVCPLSTADRLHRAWPEATYIVVPDAGHSAFEPSIARELVAATERMKQLARG
jgi:proline iminopeptidase